MVCPSKLRRELFTTAAVDNIDHNTSSTSSQSSFHGTAISLVQHPSDTENGTTRVVDTFDPKECSSKTITELPACYRDVTPIALPNKELKAPALGQQSLLILLALIRTKKSTGYHVHKSYRPTKNLIPKDFVSWAAYRASKTPLSIYKPAIVTLLPMFTENAHSLAMIRHSMKVIKVAVQHLNPLQTPVIALDQPLSALAKQIQWTLPEFDEDKFLAMMGGLHIEMASLKMLGKWLTGCGWSEIMYSAGIATQGIAASFRTASRVTRTQRAHQVTAASLHILKKKAYSAYKDKLEETEQSLPFED